MFYSFFLSLATFLIVVPLTFARGAGNASFEIFKKNKDDAELINLESRLERGSMSTLPEILLIREGDYLKASILSNNGDIRIRITDDSRQVIYETTLNQLQQEWELKTNFLLPGKRYTIRFGCLSGGYLFGVFEK